ncbi:hypothetical protein LINPERHAP2_LOCUS35178, partial [Linum perenne]
IVTPSIHPGRRSELGIEDSQDRSFTDHPKLGFSDPFLFFLCIR